jgi:cytochrome c-type biogenesis protein CcmH
LNSPPESNRLEANPIAEETTIKAASEPARPNASARRGWLGIPVLLVILAGAAYMYFGADSGSPIAVAPKATGDSRSASSGQAAPLNALSDEQLERMVVQAANQTRKEPKNASAWAMLAHSYEMLGKFAEAAGAYTRLAQLLPNDAQVLADYADVLAVTNGRSFKGEPFALLKRALDQDPKNAKALVLAGSAYVEEKDYAQAISYLEKARSAAKDAAFVRQIDGSIAQAKALSGDTPVAAAAPVVGKAMADAAGGATAAQVSGRVWLAEDLRARALPQATLFLYARPVDGSRMPVALLRKKASDLPLNFSLDDSMAMVPDVSLSRLPAVVIVARISIKGNVTPAAGDLEGISAPVSVGTKDLKLEITEVLK